MSRWSRMHDAYLSPPDGDGPSPWSEEFLGLLEDAGLPTSVCDEAVRMFDIAECADPSIEVTIDALFTVASLCREFDHEHATFWVNRVGKDISVKGDGYVDVLLEAMNVKHSYELTEEAEECAD